MAKRANSDADPRFELVCKTIERTGVGGMIVGCLTFLVWYGLAYILLPWVTSQIENDRTARDDSKQLTSAVANGITNSISLLAETVKQARHDDTLLLRELVKDVKELKSR